MEIKETDNAHFKINGNLLIKEFKKERHYLNEEWFYYYSLYCQTFPYAVTVHECSTKHLVMDYIREPTLSKMFHEKIPGSSMQECKVLLYNVQKNIYEIIASFYDFALRIDKGFWHNDLHPANLVLSNPLKLIDPDAFKLDQSLRLSTDDVLRLIVMKSHINKHINKRIDKENLNIEHLD